MEKLFTVREAAALLRISATSMETLIREGKIGVLRVTTKRRVITETALAEYIEKRATRKPGA